MAMATFPTLGRRKEGGARKGTGQGKEQEGVQGEGEGNGGQGQGNTRRIQVPPSLLATMSTGALLSEPLYRVKVEIG